MSNTFKITVEIKGILELVAAINRLAGYTDNTQVMPPVGMDQAQMGQAAPGAAQASPVQGQMPPVQQQGQMLPQVPQTQPQGQMPPQVPPVQQQGQMPPQVAAAGLMSAGKGPQVLGILQQFGIQALTELPKERYGEFAMAIREAGAQI